MVLNILEEKLNILLTLLYVDESRLNTIFKHTNSFINHISGLRPRSGETKDASFYFLAI